MIEDENIYLLKEKSFNKISDKKIEYNLTLSIFSNNTIDLTIYTNKIFPKRKFVLNCTMEELLKNRFFKIFINADEVYRELETKLSKSSIIEETNIIYLDVPIGLNIISDVILKIKQTEKSKDDVIEELNNEINILKNNNNQLQINLSNKEIELNQKELNLKMKKKN